MILSLQYCKICMLPVLRVFVEISPDNVNVDNVRQLIVQKQRVRVLEGGSVVITDDHLNCSPLKQAINDVLPQTIAKNIDVFFVVKETPVNGVLQVTLSDLGPLFLYSCRCKFYNCTFIIQQLLLQPFL